MKNHFDLIFTSFLAFACLNVPGTCTEERSMSNYNSLMKEEYRKQNGNCYYKRSSYGLIGACSFLGNECLVEFYRNETSLAKVMDCQCLENVNNAKVLQAYLTSTDYSYSLTMEAIVVNIIFGVNLVATVENGATLATGYHDYGIHLDGTDGFLDLGMQNTSCFGNVELCEAGLTISLWIKPLAGGSSKQFYFANSGINAVGLVIRQQSRTLKTAVTTANRSWISERYLLTAEEWTMVTMTWGSNDGMNLYINGCLYDTHNGESNTAVYDPRITVIGKSPLGANFFAKAVVDELFFWESVLEAEEVLLMFIDQ